MTTLADLFRSGGPGVGNGQVPVANQEMSRATFPELFGGIRQEVQAMRPGMNAIQSIPQNFLNTFFGSLVKGVENLVNRELRSVRSGEFGGNPVGGALVSAVQGVARSIFTGLGGALQSRSGNERVGQADVTPALRSGLTDIQIRSGGASLTFKNMDAPVSLQLRGGSMQEQRQGVIDFVNAKVVIDQFVRATGFRGSFGIPNAVADGKGAVSFELRLTDPGTGERKSQWIQLSNVRKKPALLLQEMQSQIYGNAPMETDNPVVDGGQSSTFRSVNPAPQFVPPGSQIPAALSKRSGEVQGTARNRDGRGQVNQPTGQSGLMGQDKADPLSSLLFGRGEENPSQTSTGSPAGVSEQTSTRSAERGFTTFAEYQQYYQNLTAQNGERVSKALVAIGDARSDAEFYQGMEALGASRQESRSILIGYLADTRQFLPFVS